MDAQEIRDAVEALVETLGIAEPWSTSELTRLLTTGKPEACVTEIARRLRLPVEIDLSYVADSDHSGNAARFQSRDLVTTDWRGQGTGGITAQILMPRNLPFYGTSSLTGFRVGVRISQNCRYLPLTFIGVMAHELSHVLLRSLMHAQRNNEVWTDLTAMVSGFSDILQAGRKTTTASPRGTVTTTYGYLSDNQFAVALKTIRGILSRCTALKTRLQSRRVELQKHLTAFRRYLYQFEALLTYLDEHPERMIRKTDAPKIVAFHQPAYTRESETAGGAAAALLTEMENTCQNLRHYTQAVTETLERLELQAVGIVQRAYEQSGKMREDVGVLRRNVGLLLRLKIVVGARLRHEGTGRRGRRKGFVKKLERMLARVLGVQEPGPKGR